jgi:hypothetical protein
VDEENKQQLVVELSFDELTLDEINAPGEKISSKMDQASLLSHFRKETDLRRHRSLDIRPIPSKSIMITGEEVFLDLYELDFRYVSSNYSFRTERWQTSALGEPQGPGEAPAARNEPKMENRGVTPEFSKATNKTKKGVENIHSGLGGRLEILSIQAVLFRDFLGFHSDQSCSLQENIEALFLPMIFARSLVGVRPTHPVSESHNLYAAPEDEILKTHLEQSSHNHLKVFPVEKSLRYPALFFTNENGKLESAPWRRNINFQTPVRLTLPNRKGFCGTIYNWSVNYKDFDKTGNANRADLQFNVLGIHELNSTEETL